MTVRTSLCHCHARSNQNNACSKVRAQPIFIKWIKKRKKGFPKIFQMLPSQNILAIFTFLAICKSDYNCFPTLSPTLDIIHPYTVTQLFTESLSKGQAQFLPSEQSNSTLYQIYIQIEIEIEIYSFVTHYTETMQMFQS